MFHNEQRVFVGIDRRTNEPSHALQTMGMESQPTSNWTGPPRRQALVPKLALGAFASCVRSLTDGLDKTCEIEVLNLASHGARAQDQSFNIIQDWHFDAGIAPIELVPRDATPAGRHPGPDGCTGSWGHAPACR